MHSDCDTFFGLTRCSLVRYGADDKLAHGQHKTIPVYTEMYIQICRDYNVLPEIRSITLSEMRFFYNALRSELKEHTKPRNK